MAGCLAARSPFSGWVGIVYAQLYAAPLLRAVNLDSPLYKVPTPEQIAAYAGAVAEHFALSGEGLCGPSRRWRVATRRSIGSRRRISSTVTVLQHG